MVWNDGFLDKMMRMYGWNDGWNDGWMDEWDGG